MGGSDSKEGEGKEQPTNNDEQKIQCSYTNDVQKWEFNPRKEDWESYTERLEMYFVASDVPEFKRTAVLLSRVGPRTYGLMKDLCAPAKPSTKKYNELVKLVNDRLGSVPKLRYRFHQAKQAPMESITDFVTRLRLLASHCNFDNPDDRVCDQLVFGLLEDQVRNTLLGQSTLTFAKACKIASGNDAERDDKKQAKKSSDNHHVREEHCYCCGKTNHLTRDCHFRFQKGGIRQLRGGNSQENPAKNL